jgi:hypothetical protein
MAPQKRFLFADKLLIIVFFIALGLFRPDLIMIVGLIATPLYLAWTKRLLLYKHFITATLLAIVWLIIAHSQYGYGQNFITIAGLNIFPLIAWSLGLFAIYIIYSYWENSLQTASYVKQLGLFNLFYIPLLLTAETVAYKLFDIHNIQTAQYVSLPICDCLHAPVWMQISYILMGTIYFSACYFLRLENPHK